jgi:outer membrane lipoprotein-sorting protein
MDSQQIELINKVSTYFNQMNSLRGEFVQTSAGGKRLRGKFYVKRPGRFRLDYARPSRLVIVSDGRHVAIQDHDLKTDDRWELEQTPFGVVLRQDVNLLRDARFFEVQETDDTIVVAFEDKNQQAPGPLKMFLAKKPTLELRKWITKDLQGLDTLVELSNIAHADDFAPDLFKPASVTLDRLVEKAQGRHDLHAPVAEAFSVGFKDQPGVERVERPDIGREPRPHFPEHGFRAL